MPQLRSATSAGKQSARGGLLQLDRRRDDIDQATWTDFSAEIEHGVFDRGAGRVSRTAPIADARTLSRKDPRSARLQDRRRRHQHVDDRRWVGDNSPQVSSGCEADPGVRAAEQDTGPSQSEPRWLSDAEEEDAPGQTLPRSLVDQPFDTGATESEVQRLFGADDAGLGRSEGEEVI